MYTYKLPVLIIVFVCILGLTQTFGETQAQTIRVGIFQNNPLSFMDEKGQAQDDQEEAGYHACQFGERLLYDDQLEEGHNQDNR